MSRCMGMSSKVGVMLSLCDTYGDTRKIAVRYGCMIYCDVLVQVENEARRLLGGSPRTSVLRILTEHA